ncbi:hypothetical protein HC749_19570 [Arthrobacter sp. S13_S34]|nr:hypothetical protein [Arthrobacter sp. S13_S34]
MTLRVSPLELVRRAEATGELGLVGKHPSWSRVRLGDIASVVNGAAFKSAKFNIDGLGMALIRIRDVGSGQVSTWYDGDWDERYLVAPGDLLVGMDGDFRSARWTTGQGLLNQRVCRIDVDSERYEPAFLEYALPGYLDLIWAATSSTTVKHLSSRSIQDIPLPNPPLEEQRQIVEILEDHLSRLEAAENYASAASRRLVSLHESNLQAALADYQAEYRPLGELLAMPLSNGRSVPTREGGFPVLRLTAIKQHGVDLQERKGGAWTASEARRFLVSEGDFLISRGNGSIRLVGRGSLVRHHPDPVAFPDTVIRARPNPEVISAEFLDHIWNSHGPRRQIESMARTTAGIYKVNQKQLALVQVPVPPLDVQSTIAASARSSRTAIEGVAGSIELVERRSHGLRRAVLAAAFRGKLTGRHTDKEVIEELAEISSSHSKLSVTV